MRQITSIVDEIKGLVTYELADGRRVRMDAREVRKHGAANLLRAMGLGDQVPTARVPVKWDGRIVGSVPGDFDPLSINSRSWLYDPRPGDFVRDGDTWVAANMLGPGDLEAVSWFEWDHQS